MSKDTVIVIGLILAIGFSGLALVKSGTVERVTDRVVEREGVGAFVGPDIYDRVYFHSSYIKGGETIATSSTASTYTLTTDEIDFDVSYVSWTPNTNVTLTTMASSAAPLGGLKTGEEFTQLWYNASTSGSATITFAAGTGVDLQEDEGGSVVVNGLETARLTYVKKSDTDVAVIVEPYQVGD